MSKLSTRFILALLTAGLVWIAYISIISATTEVCYCHNVNNNPHTICTSNQGLINGHNNHVNNGEDYVGECRVEPTPEVTPVPTDVPEATPTSTPSATPTAKPTNAPGPKGPPEWENPCFYLADHPECKTKPEIVGVQK